MRVLSEILTMNEHKIKLITLFVTIVITIIISSSSRSSLRIRPFGLIDLEGKESVRV
jgi:hypothetical protein